MIDVVFLSFWILTDPLQAKILTFEERVRDFILKTRIKKIDQERWQILNFNHGMMKNVTRFC